MRQSFGEVFARFNSLAETYLPRELYVANREADKKDIKAVSDELARQSSTRWRWMSTVIVPLLVGAAGALASLLAFAAERH